MSLMASLPAIGLDQVLRTPAAGFRADPSLQAQHWIADSLMAVPLFALGTWTGDRIAARAGIGSARSSDLVKRSIIMTLACAVLIAPFWFGLNQLGNPANAQPLVAPRARDSGDLYSVAPGVIITLVSACLVPAAFWAGRIVTATAPVIGRIAVPAVLAATVPVLAWLLYLAAAPAYASQVYYTPAPAPAPAAQAHPAPYSFARQSAHALQDGLAGQSAGLPAMALTAIALRARSARTAGRAAQTSHQGGTQ